jgi:hypothetical protein
MAIPNLVSEVEAARQKYPEAWRNAHTGNANTEDFIRLCVRDIRAKHGNRWGLNGKRGNPNDISDDIITYSGEGTAVDVTNGNAPMEIIDVIGGAGGPNPQPVWNPGPGGPGDRGAFVGTFSVPDAGGGTPGGGGTPPGPICPDPNAHKPKPPVSLDRGEFFNEMRELDRYYSAPEGLQRPQGLSIDGRPDFEGLGAWLFDVYLNSRLQGKSPADARAAYVKAIRQSGEWQQKHPGETP